MKRDIRIAIVGAGVSGLAMGVKLKKAGFNDFTIFEQSDGVGGTWRDNHYPGCEVDIASHAYSFSFFTYDWSRNYAPQSELLQYCEDVADHFDLRPHLRLNTKVEEAVWDDGAQGYRLHLAGGAEEQFDVLVSCLGLLSVPRYPDWPGLDTFEGISFHPARWEHQHDFRGKRVAVVGVGSTSAQVAPAMAELGAAKVYVYQRQPGWVFPKGVRDYTPEERRRFRRYPMLQHLERHKIFFVRQRPKRMRAVHRADTKGQWKIRARLEAWIRSEVHDPETAKALTPDFPVGCKRPVFSDDFYTMFNRENVELVPHPVVSVTRNSIVDATGTAREVDAIIPCTGFHPTDYIASMEVTGVGGQTIHEIWKGNPSAFLGLSVPGIPNFFMLYGPNTNGGVSIMSNAERQAGAVVAALRKMRRTGARVVETRDQALNWWVRWVDRANAKKRTSADPKFCTSYFFSAGGRNATQFPSTTRVYTFLLHAVWMRGLRLRPSRGG